MFKACKYEITRFLRKKNKNRRSEEKRGRRKGSRPVGNNCRVKEEKREGREGNENPVGRNMRSSSIFFSECFSSMNCRSLTKRASSDTSAEDEADEVSKLPTASQVDTQERLLFSTLHCIFGSAEWLKDPGVVQICVASLSATTDRSVVVFP